MKLLVYGWVRQEIESKKSWLLIIPIPIKALCNKYHGFVFTESTILDDLQQFQLWKLLSTKIKFDKTVLLYNALRDGFTEHGFYKNIEGKKPTLIIAHTNYGNIYGVFTSVKWKNGTEFSHDKDAFVWLLKSKKGSDIKPQIFEAKSGSMGVYQNGQTDEICFFESPCLFSFASNCNIKDSNFAFCSNKYGIKDASILCGGDTKIMCSQKEIEGYKFGCIDAEIFQISRSYEYH